MIKSEASERHCAIPGTRLEWVGLRGWLDAVYDIQRKMRCSERNYQRAGKLYTSLTISDIRACSDLGVVQELEGLLRQARYTDAPLRWGLGRVWNRSQLGTLIAEATNHGRNLTSGKAPREKGPSFDVTRIPTSKLELLIQTHRDLDVVERLRDERRRRFQS